MARVFLDCGAHKFEGLREFINILKIDKEWQVHSFEANPTITKNFEEHLDDSWDFDHYVHKCAVGARDGKIQFISEYADQEVGGMGSRLASNWYHGIYDYGGGRAYEVDIINFPSWLKETFNEDDEVHVKLDVEGAEFEVLEELVKDVPSQLKSIFIEWHERFFPDPEAMFELRKKYTRMLQDTSVIVRDWK